MLRNFVLNNDFSAMVKASHILLFISLYLFLNATASQAQQAIIEGERFQPKQATHGMVATSHYLATAAAAEVLRQGRNAVDAAVTAGFVLAVTQPRSGNIGGGGFMLISQEETDKVIAIDYREKAPHASHKDMFIDSTGRVDNNLSRFSHLAAGVPGTVAGLSLALRKFGTISLSEALEPAIRLAEDGFILHQRFADGVLARKETLWKHPSSRKVFFKADGSPYRPGEVFIQKELAATLRRIAEHGSKEFYSGKTARLLVEHMQKNGGLITMEDLQNYSAVIRTPVRGSYRGYEVYSMSPPSSGGTHIIQILNILEGYPLATWGHNSAKTIHIMAEAMKRAYADRATYLGDTDYVHVPLAGLTSKSYAASIRQTIDTSAATSSSQVKEGKPAYFESSETTHFSIVDQYGNAVANTYTINFSYGSGIVVEGAGYLLNNQMDDFSAQPGTPNAYGLIGGEANMIEPGKRMLSSMSPTIVKKDGKNFMVTGSPGGSRIITTTLQVVSNVIDHNLNIQSAVNAPRIHHQWLPDELRVEEGFSPDTLRLLTGMGHTVVQKSAMGALQSIVIKDGIMYAGSDPRRSTSLAEGISF